MSDLLSQVQYYDKYSRYRYDLWRRENWKDTVKRATEYLFTFDKKNVISTKERQEIYEAIFNKEVAPSMRNLAMGGKAAERQNICSFNCAYGAVDDLYFFYETVIILMSGAGLGFSVEDRYISKLPLVKKQSKDKRKILFRIPDTTEGWAEAIYFGIREWYKGNDVRFDFSQVRPAGSVLKVKGGRASGSKVLDTSLKAIRQIVLSNQEQRLNSLSVHDIMCHIAKCIVSGGVRRAAMISIFDLDDKDMLTCKNPENIRENEQRYLSNNSAVFENELPLTEIRQFMNGMFDSYSGEPGIFSRYAIDRTLPNRRKKIEDFGGNACLEIGLRPLQFCNLSSVILREGDDLTSLKRKVRLATVIGTLQSMSEHFPGLRSEWKDNQIEERLLGVDLNGIMDVPFIRDPRILEILKKHAIDVNKEYSLKLGINQSAAITCVKPSGNSSVLLDTSPGIHARWSSYYIRRIQLNESNPILNILRTNGVPVEKSNHLPNTYVAAFPVKSPDAAITNGDYSALDQLENWKLFKVSWAEHSVSCTISYHQDEQEGIIHWVYENQDTISGLSFLPKSNTVYEQMPYERITESQYNDLMTNFPKTIDWGDLHGLETGDNTNASQVAACSGEKCLISF